MPHVSNMPFLFVSLVFISMFVYWLVLSWFAKKKEIFSMDISKVNLSFNWPFM